MPTSTDWLQKAADAGTVQAMVMLGEDLLTNGDHKKALKWFRQAASSESPEGMFGVAKISYDAKDFQEALKWFRKAAERNHEPSCFHLGYMYYAGEGTKPDIEQSKFWYEKSAKAGNADAMVNLSLLLGPNPPAPKTLTVKRVIQWSSAAVVVLMFSMLWITGCFSDKNDGIFNPPDSAKPIIDNAKVATTQISNNVGAVSGTMQQNSDRLTNVTNTIKKDATDGRNATPSNAQFLYKHWDNIIGSTSELFSIRDANDKANDKLKAQKEKIDELTVQLNNAASQQASVESVYSNKVNELIADISKLQEEKRTGDNKRYTSFIILCCAGIGVSAIITFALHRKAGIAGVVGCVAALGSTFLIKQVSFYLINNQWIVGGFILVGVIFAIYRIILLKRAQVENTKVVESVKQLLPTSTRKWFFGDGAITGEVTKYQSPSTRKIVDHVRTKIKNAPPPPPDEKPMHPLGKVLPISPA